MYAQNVICKYWYRWKYLVRDPATCFSKLSVEFSKQRGIVLLYASVSKVMTLNLITVFWNQVPYKVFSGGSTLGNHVFEHKSKEIYSKNEKCFSRIAVCSIVIQHASFKLKDLHFYCRPHHPETPIGSTLVSRKNCNGDSLMARPLNPEYRLRRPAALWMNPAVPRA